jgi:hypothetical protein
MGGAATCPAAEWYNSWVTLHARSIHVQGSPARLRKLMRERELRALRRPVALSPRSYSAPRTAGRLLPFWAALLFLAVVVSVIGKGASTHRPDSRLDQIVANAPRAALRGSGILEGLKWLARHQAEDGSWGRHLRTCMCPDCGLSVPPVKVRDPEVEKKALPLIDALDRDEPLERDEATAGLKAMGEKVEPFLEDALLSGGVEARSRARDLLAELRRLREPEPPVGTTAWSLMAFLGAGYSHLSRDEYDGLEFGVVVKKAIKWLLARQNADGSIGPADRADAMLQHAWATLALSEAYGMTASQPFKDPAQKAASFLLSRQSADGGWNRRSPALDAEILPSVYAVMALKSAVLSELAIDAPRLAKAHRYFDSLPDKDGLCGSPPTRAAVGGTMTVFLSDRKAQSEPRLTRAAEWLSKDKPQRNVPDFPGWYLASIALFQFAGPEGSHWKGWNESIKNVIIPAQETHGCMHGSWSPEGELAGIEGLRVASTAVAVTTLELHFRYANVFGGR